MSEPSQGPIEALLHEVWQSVAPIDAGTVADYIPELAKADPATFGLSLATMDGAIYTVGALVPFTIQSVSKPFVYALALADSGPEAVLAKVGAEPTGDPFNTISLDDVSGRAFNPMVNAGAIVTANLVAGRSRAEQFDRILDGLSSFAGRDLSVDEDVFVSERDTGDRNRAIAYLMRSAGLLDEDVDAQVELYFRQCSIVVTARDLSIMAATLANAGVNPITGEQVVPRHAVAPVLTVMSTCGMYDYAGEWLYRVGMPAKSGVSGAVAAALPGQLGLAVHSPRLDERGNSVRGVTACEQLSHRLGLHLLRPGDRSRPNLRRTYRGDAVHSKRARRRAERQLLEESGGAIAVHELVGDQGFVGAESLVRAVLGDPQPARWRMFDLGRVTRVDLAARTLLAGLVAQLDETGVEVALVEPRTRGPREVVADLGVEVARFADSDSALEWCETQLLGSLGRDGAQLADGLVPLAEQDLLRDLPVEVVEAIEARTVTRVFTPGTVVFDEGALPDGVYFVGAGEVVADVRVRGQRGRRRLSSVAAGSAFGELALVDGRPRSTRIVAVEPTMCHVLSPEAFVDLQHREPVASSQLALAIARSLSQRLRTSTAEVAALEEV
ncbi:MAG TPA: glutaminase A [Candidatus Nanopelagicales bacterium]